MDALAILHSLQEDVTRLDYGDQVQADALKVRAKLIVTRSIGADSRYLEDIDSICFVVVTAEDYVESYLLEVWENAKRTLLCVLRTIEDDLNLNNPPPPDKAKAIRDDMRGRIFERLTKAGWITSTWVIEKSETHRIERIDFTPLGRAKIKELYTLLEELGFGGGHRTWEGEELLQFCLFHHNDPGGPEVGGQSMGRNDRR